MTLITAVYSDFVAGAECRAHMSVTGGRSGRRRPGAPDPDGARRGGALGGRGRLLVGSRWAPPAGQPRGRPADSRRPVSAGFGGEGLAATESSSETSTQPGPNLASPGLTSSSEGAAPREDGIGWTRLGGGVLGGRASTASARAAHLTSRTASPARRCAAYRTGTRPCHRRRRRTPRRRPRRRPSHSDRNRPSSVRTGTPAATCAGR